MTNYQPEAVGSLELGAGRVYQTHSRFIEDKNLEIDLNQPFTTGDVAALLASKDDTKNRQLRVSLAGIAELSDTVGADNISGLAFRMETWCVGNGYTGAGAAADGEFVARVEKVLRDNWPNPKSSYIDVF